VKTLFEYLEDSYSLDEFLECFPSSAHSIDPEPLLEDYAVDPVWDDDP
jgi:hypothetical protein